MTSPTVTRVQSNLYEDLDACRFLIDSVKDCAVYLLDAVGCVVNWNAGAERLCGYPEASVLGQSVELFYTPEDRAQGVPERELQLARNGTIELDGWRVRRNGSRFPAQITISPRTDAAGAPCGFACVTRDLSSRHQLEERFRLIIDFAPNAMVMVDGKGVIEMVNLQTERLFGYARSELLGQSIEILLPQRFRDGHPAMRAEYFANPESRPMGKGRDLYALRRDGSVFPVEIGLNPIPTGEGIKVLSAIVDISDRKQKEQRIQAALQEKDILLGEIHHRVKNNLQVVHSLLDLQSTRIRDESVREMLRDSQNRIRSMALIHQSLYQSKDFARVNFNSVLETLVPILLQSYRSGDQELEFELDANDVRISLNLAVPCGLIVNELITNAIKHAFPDRKQGTIRMELRETDQEVVLSISDDGIGLPADLDLRNCSTLGLQLVSLLADQMQAELTINPAHPTRFSLRFGCTEAPGGSPCPPPS